MTEIWKPVVGFEGLYEVSNLGRVRSLDRVLTSGSAKRGYPRKVRGVVLSPQKHSAGYLHVRLSGETRIVSWLVLEAFEGLRPKQHEVCHNNGDKLDNRLSNLRYDTHVLNCADRVKHGSQRFGEDVRTAKLSEDGVRAIRAAQNTQGLAKKYGVHPHHIHRLRRREQWKYV